MNEYINKMIQDLKEKLTTAITYTMTDYKMFMFFKLSLAFSTITLVLIFYKMRLNHKFNFSHAKNLGYICLIKPNITKYDNLLKNKKTVSKFILNSFVKKFYSFPNGITNFGNNCYINVLLQVIEINF